jgi:nicotinamidase-related amidase
LSSVNPCAGGCHENGFAHHRCAEGLLWQGLAAGRRPGTSRRSYQRRNRPVPEEKWPVVCVQHTNPEDNLVPGQPGFDLPEILKILPEDLHIHKTYSNSFTKTGLADKLREMGVDTVIVTGFAAEACVLATVRGAEDYDLTGMLLRGSIIGGRVEVAPFIESICEIISYYALCKVME